MSALKVLELFAGTRSVGKAFEAAGHDVFSVDWDESFDHIDYCGDVLDLTTDFILGQFGRPDIIWASPDCTTYSIAAISHHRTKEPNGNLTPISEYAKKCDEVNQHVLSLSSVNLPQNTGSSRTRAAVCARCPLWRVCPGTQLPTASMGTHA